MSRNEKNLELLNSYLDRQLSDAEALTFAKKLAEDASLLEELNELHAVKRRLGQLRDVKAPRKYILTRAEAAAAKKPGLLERLFPAFRLSAAVSMIALIILTVLPFKPMNLKSTSEPVAKSVSLTEFLADAENSSQDYSLESIASGAVLPVSDPAATPEAVSPEATPQYFSSQGVRGGSPKQEILSSAERRFPDDRTYWSEEEELFDEERATMELNGKNALTNHIPARIDRFMLSFTVIGVIQLLLCAVLIVSLVWMLLTMAKRFASLR